MRFTGSPIHQTENPTDQQQEVSIVSSNDSTSLEVLPNNESSESHDSVQRLTERLSTALSNIKAKEELVKQHSKVAEEAILGWEKAENEVGALKKQLEVRDQRNLILQDEVSHLEAAIKECVRQLQQSKEDQEKKIHDAVFVKTQEWESVKSRLEDQVYELQGTLQETKDRTSEYEAELQAKLENVNKEISSLKYNLLVQADELKVITLERDLSTQVAETASKQHLESTKKVAKLEAECRRLRTMVRKTSSMNDTKYVASSSVYVESVTDSHSDSGERSILLENDIQKLSSLELNEGELSCSDSWASALIAELDQFRNEKVRGVNSAPTSVNMNLMDDFLEMEKLVSLPEHGNARGGFEDLARIDQIKGPEESELDAMLLRNTEMEEMIRRLESEKVDLEIALAESQEQLNQSHIKLIQVQEKLVGLLKEMQLVNDVKQTTIFQLVTANVNTRLTESMFEMVELEMKQLHEKLFLLEKVFEEEKQTSANANARCQYLEDELLRKKCQVEIQLAAKFNSQFKIKQEKELSIASAKLAECQKVIATLERQLKLLATSEDDFLMIDLKMRSDPELALEENIEIYDKEH